MTHDRDKDRAARRPRTLHRIPESRCGPGHRRERGSAGLLIAVAAATGVWLLHHGVPLHVDAPPLGAQWLPHAGPGTLPAVFVALLVVLRGPQLAARLPWRGLLVASAATTHPGRWRCWSPRRRRRCYSPTSPG